jgi:rhodanese-related sulfurtransferase
VARSMNGDPDCTEVYPELFVGGLSADVGFDGEVIDAREAFESVPGGGWQPRIDVADAQVNIIAAGRNAGRRVLVHCSSGIERSPAIVVLYLVRKKGFTPTEAYTLIRAARPQILEEPDLLPLTYDERTR